MLFIFILSFIMFYLKRLGLVLCATYRVGPHCLCIINVIVCLGWTGSLGLLDKLFLISLFLLSFNFFISQHFSSFSTLYIVHDFNIYPQFYTYNCACLWIDCGKLKIKSNGITYEMLFPKKW